MARILSVLLALFSILSVGLLYRAASESAINLSPQGCRMSYMSPSYLVQSRFDTSWTPLAKRYSLLLYREVGWQDNEPRGVPVLFIPGNAGSARQIRSIASSAARQYYASPFLPSPEFTSRHIKPLDFFAVEYNEDLSAFHGPTLDVEREYATRAISYILSLYPNGTSIIVLGHSMGGVVATSLLPSTDISAVITMSTPHRIPPARFDRRIAAIYDTNLATLATTETPILSLCGGAADLMVPSESCILPEVANRNAYRQTVFSSALEGCWTGVGHQVIVWCHQVRWRIARAALELGAASSPLERGFIVDHWLRNGRFVSPAPEYPARLDLSQESYAVQPPGPFVLRELHTPKAVHLAPVPETNHPTRFVAYVSEGSVLSTSPRHPSSLSVTFYLCSSSANDPYHVSSRPACEEWHPTILKLIPNASPEKSFPVPNEGVDESEGVIVFEAVLPERSDQHRWVAVAYSTSEKRGWILGDFVTDEPFEGKFSFHDLLYKDVSIPLNPGILSRVHLPFLLSNALLVYRVSATNAEERLCSESHLPPLLEHASFSEAHFHPLTHSRPLLLHTHTSAPFITSPHSRGLNLTLYTSQDCRVTSLHLRIDWWGSLGRASARYWTAVPGWAVGVVTWLIFTAVGISEQGEDSMPSVSETLSLFTRKTLPRFLVLSFVVSLLPLPQDYVLGNGGEVALAFLTPLILLLATGWVIVSWWVICIIMLPIRKLGRNPARRKKSAGVSRSTILSILFVLFLVAVIVPWQVAFLGCWVIHFVTCATYITPVTSDATTPPRSLSPSRNSPAPPLTSRYDADHVLLLLTWLLPLAAPILAVWVRTLATAGPTALDSVGRGDHNFLSVAPYLILVDYASWARGPLLLRNKLEVVSARWCLLPPVVVAFLRGARHTYEVFDWVWVAMFILVALRVGPKFLAHNHS
ncbi:PGAP1-like protein-domain-containing protein [Russula earlei]|uniref:PGAP1-like protein-domain-containing protein n=1 Tax=Russula earlei TaxID=71964 RepID=A0ACC0UGD3_9AGAM|nr:PGAP1-like protein-domain-containing protein [Russula earlei]